ncbi:transcriptional repressor LexA [Spirochaeta africana]|uniref:LexA repressor n=1 Tax=Spirochaeta africana (strain ATCC 700263 / DSM 8902 / Z-7692) TaxID=889378 RepID=H9UME7_SPIAZ|nr:transcriptional repressor LexA [Spirochaeta africana]AFG38690.1 SOS regulatory protein LexA [Spirochaeta africana DSM 8902]
MQELTRRQQEVFACIEAFIASHSYPPTMREVAEALSISVKAAYDHIDSLQRKGWVRRAAHQSRSLELLVKREPEQTAPEVIEVPLLGDVAAGKPLLAEENCETMLSLPASMLGRGRFFALRVRGDSMIDAGIHSGDVAVVQQQSTARNGDIVVALLDDAATLKHFYKETNRIMLKSANPQYPPIYTQDVRVLGKLAHILRSYS